MARGQSHWQGCRTFAGTAQIDKSRILLGLMECVHQIKYVVGEFATRSVFTSRAQGVGHVRNADAPTVLVVGMRQGHLLPITTSHPPLDKNRSTKGVWIGDRQ